MEVDEGSDQKSDIKPHWMAAHARLKTEFTEDEKCHNLMSWLICWEETTISKAVVLYLIDSSLLKEMGTLKASYNKSYIA